MFDLDLFTGTARGPTFYFNIHSDDTLTGYGCFSTFGESDCYDLDTNSKRYQSGQWS